MTKPDFARSTAWTAQRDFDNDVCRQAAVSTALIAVFRGNFCDAILPDRRVSVFKKHQVIYDIGDRDRSFFFLRNGFVKLGSITSNGREVIYDVRTGGDVVGELCAAEPERPDRAVALEQTEAIVVPLEDVITVLLAKPDLVTLLMSVFCRALREAYEQVNILAVDDTVHRLAKVLIGLARKVGRRSGPLIEISTYITQEEIAQMVGARRERISTALNTLRRQGVVLYTTRGHLALNTVDLERMVTS